jgi:copper chaperone CopZ
MAALAPGSRAVTERFPVRGMTCGSCVEHVRAALAVVPGVEAVGVDLATGRATVRYDPTVGSLAALRRAVAGAGYLLEDGSPAESTAAAPLAAPSLRPIAVGALAAAGLLALYLGLITLAQGWAHAAQQLADDRWFVAAIMLGFGTQAGLFAHLRELHARTSAGGVAASTGTSTTAMLACCAHHLTEVLPILGLSGAAVFLNAYKTPLLWLGIAMNAAGIAYLLGQLLRRPRLAPPRDESSQEHQVP